MGAFVAKLLNGGIGILNVHSCELGKLDVAEVLLLTYSLRCAKLECLIMGGNRIGKEMESLAVYNAMFNAPNTYVDISASDSSSVDLLKFLLRREEKRSCEVLQHSPNYSCYKNKEFRHFHGKDSLLAAVAFGYLEQLIEKDLHKRAPLKLLYKLYPRSNP